MRYEHLLSRVYNQPLVIEPEKLETFRQVFLVRMAGVQVDGAMLAEMRAASAERSKPQTVKAVGVLPIYGTLAKRMGMLEESSGGVSVDRLAAEFDRMLSDESIGSILLDVDSPGGESFGIMEFAAKIFAARSVKPIAAIANPMMASGALWLGLAAETVSVTPSGVAGSLGVYCVHTDLSAAKEALGVKVTYISAGEHKVDFRENVPLTDEARAYYQSQVDAIYADFVRDVAKFRGRSVADVKENFGKGRMMRAPDAKVAGMVDRVETFEDVVARLSGVKRKGAKVENLRRRLDLRRAT